MYVGFFLFVVMDRGYKFCFCGEVSGARVSGLGYFISLILGR